MLSSAWHQPRRCVITDDCHSLVPSHGEASDLNCAAVNLQNFTCEALTLSGWVVLGGGGGLNTGALVESCTKAVQLSWEVWCHMMINKRVMVLKTK